MTYLQQQSGTSSIWDTATDCKTRFFNETRCEPGQEPLRLFDSATGTTSDICSECVEGTYSPNGAKCIDCVAPLVLTPDPWWCQKEIDANGHVIKPARSCLRNLRCFACSAGLVPNANRTACEDSLSAAGEDDSLVSLGDSVSAAQATATMEIDVDNTQFDGGPLEQAYMDNLKTAVATSMGVTPNSIALRIVGRRRGLLKGVQLRRRVQDVSRKSVEVTLKPGVPSSKLFNLEKALANPGSAQSTALRTMGIITDTFGTGSKCPDGTMKAGADVLCHKCPFPQITRNAQTCEHCPVGQVPTEKSDQCRCGDGYYNVSRGKALCLSAGSILTAQETARDGNGECAPCPEGDCATCADGVLRVKAGFSIPEGKAIQGLAADVIAGSRPIWPCVTASGIDPEEVCPGDEGPNPAEVGPNRAAAAPFHWWENEERCDAVLLDGSAAVRSKCLQAGACSYTPAVSGSTPERCDPLTFTINTWCGEGYMGALCSNCADGYGRTGVDRSMACDSCDNSLPGWFWIFFLIIFAGASFKMEEMCCGRFNPWARPPPSGKAPIGVALVIGNGQYENWPSLDAADNDCEAMAHALEHLGYVVIQINDATKEELLLKMDEFQAAVADVTDPAQYIELANEIRARGGTAFSPWPCADSPGLKDEEVATIIFYSGHATQLDCREGTGVTPALDGGDTLNCIVPTDASLNPTEDELLLVKDLFKGCQGNTGPTVVFIDAAHAVATGPFDETERDIFRCPLTGEIMQQPVRLYCEPEGWAYEKAALKAVLAKDKLTAHNTKFSPMSGSVIQDPTPEQIAERGVSSDMAALFFDDDDLQESIRQYMERSTLRAFTELPTDNSILVMAAEPHSFSAEPVDDPTKKMTFGPSGKRGLFTTELMRVLTEPKDIRTLMAEVRALVTTQSRSTQVPWSLHNLREDSAKFCLCGKFPPAEEEETIADCRIGLQTFEEEEAEHEKKNVNSSSLLVQFVTVFMIIKPTLFIVIGMGQVLAAVSSVFAVNFPELFQMVILPFTAISIDIFGSINFLCMLGSTWDFVDNFYGQIIVIPLWLATCVAAYKIRDVLLSRAGEPPADEGPSVAHPLGGKVRQDLRALTLEVLLTTMFLIYPKVSQTTFQAFMCQTLDAEGDDEEAWMVADFQVACDTDKHAALMYLASLFVLIYPIGIPAVLFAILYTRRDALQVEGSKTRHNWAAMVKPFKLEFWYWFPLEMYRKLIFTGLFLFYKRGSLNQLIWGVQISTLFLIMVVYNRPFTRKLNNTLKIITDAGLTVTLNVAILLNERVDKELEEKYGWSQPFIGAFLIFTNILIPFMVIIFEIGHGTMVAEEETEPLTEVNGVRWPFARYEGGKFHGGKKGDTAELSLLRRALEHLDEETLLKNAFKAGIEKAKRDWAEYSTQTKSRMIELLMERARKEGNGWGPWREPTGVIRRLYVENEVAIKRRLKREAAEAAEEEQKRLALEARGIFLKSRKGSSSPRASLRGSKSGRKSPKSPVTMEFNNPLTPMFEATNDGRIIESASTPGVQNGEDFDFDDDVEMEES
jgi:hypothetical protein